MVDKLTEYSYFIPLTHPYIASKLAMTYMTHVFKLHGILESIISYKDPTFTSNFWKSSSQDSRYQALLQYGLLTPNKRAYWNSEQVPWKLLLKVFRGWQTKGLVLAGAIGKVVLQHQLPCINQTYSLWNSLWSVTSPAFTIWSWNHPSCSHYCSLALPRANHAIIEGKFSKG